MKRIISILLGLALVLGLSLVMTMPVGAATTWYVDPSGTDDGSHGTGPGAAAWQTIQYAVDNVISGDTIMVGAGTYAGAIVNKEVEIVGAAGGGSVITSGVCYNAACSPALTTAFRLDAGADGTEIRNFTIQCNAGSSFYFGVFSRGVDYVTVDNLEISGTVQGITSWGGSDWVITNNRVTSTVATSGGGVAVFLGATPPTYRICSDNLVQYNAINATATHGSFTCPGIVACLDVRYSYDDLNFSEDVSGNQILGNSIVGNGGANSAGVEIGVIGLGTNSTKIAATMGIIDDNYVEDNTIDDVDLGLYFYVVQDLTVRCNEVKNCVTHGISIWDDFTGTIHFNSIAGNAYGLYSDVSSRTVDATDNWWGAANGPGDYGPGSGDDVSDYVDYDPFVTAAYAAQDSVTTATATGTASFETTDGNLLGLTAVTPPATPPVELPHGMFNFTICCFTGPTVTLNMTFPDPIPEGYKWWKYVGGSWYSLPIGSNDGDEFITVTLRDNVLPDDEDTVPGQITDQGGPGGPLAVGWDTYPVGKPRVLLPWIALLVAVVAGASLLVVRRRRAQS